MIKNITQLIVQMSNEPFHIITAACTWMLWGQTSLYILGSAKFKAFTVCY